MLNHVTLTPHLYYVCQYYRHGKDIFFTSACSAFTLLVATRFSGMGVLLQKSQGLNLLVGVDCISLASRRFTSYGHS